MNIKHVFDLNLALDYGPYAWPGGYPLFFWTADGAALSFKAVQENAGLVRDAIINHDVQSGWCVVASDINWEDTELYCANECKPIELAYGDNHG